MARQALLNGPALQPQLDAAMAKALAEPTDEQRRLTIGRQRVAHRRPGRQRFARPAADRYQPCLGALADDADLAFVQHRIQRLAIKRRQFGQTQTGRIEQFEHRRVAGGKNIVFVICRRQQAPSLLDRQRIRQMPRRLRWAHALAGIGADQIVDAEPGEEAAPGR